MRICVAIGTFIYVTVTAIAIAFSGVKRSVGHMAIPTGNRLPVFRMTVDTCGYIPVVFAVIHREVIVDINMTSSAHFFCSGIFESGIPDRKMRVAVTPKTDASIPLCIF
jgi:hypothetical protein